MIGGLAASALPLRSGRMRVDPLVTGERINSHLTALSEFGKNPQGGV